MPTIAPNLDWHRQTATGKANDRIDALRRAFATDIAFQQEAYYKKRAEAEAYLATQPISLDGFPLLEQITQIRNMTPVDLANLWISTNDQWGPILNTTEILREKALVQISNASSKQEIYTALDQLEADLSASGLL